MNSTLKTGLWLAALLVAVIVVSFLYSRSLRTPGHVSTPALPASVPLALPDELHPDLQAGLAALEADDPSKAVEHLLRVPDGDPGYLLALQRLGLAHLEAGDPVASLEAFRGYSARRPNDAEAHRLRGRAYFRVGRFVDAEFATLRALELEPQDLAARYDVALFRLVQGRLPEAISAYRRAMRLDSQGSEVPYALNELEGLHAQRPELADVHYALAFFAGSMGNVEFEQTELEHYLELAPSGAAAENARRMLDGQPAPAD